MEKRYQVPEGMLQAAVDSVARQQGMNDATRMHYKTVLEAALRWLSENPIVPTTKQAVEMICKLALTDPDQLPKINQYQTQELVSEWQRQMFLAPEISPFVQSVIKSFTGRTVAPHEADEIVKELGYVAHGWDFGRKSEPNTHDDREEAMALGRAASRSEPEVDRIDYYYGTADGKYVPIGSAKPGDPFVHYKPVPEVPEEVKDLLCGPIPGASDYRVPRESFNAYILEAYRRGKESK